jgi:hypothetical protein
MSANPPVILVDEYMIVFVITLTQRGAGASHDKDKVPFFIAGWSTTSVPGGNGTEGGVGSLIYLQFWFTFPYRIPDATCSVISKKGNQNCNQKKVPRCISDLKITEPHCR